MENTEEIWKDIVGYEDYYQVSNKGRVMSKDRRIKSCSPNGRIIKGILRKPLIVRGYMSINLQDKKGGKSTRNGIHVFVAQAFLPNPNNKLEVNHINGVKSDNRVENLEWCTRQENVRHAIDTGLHKHQPMSESTKAILREKAKHYTQLKDWKKINKDRVREMALFASLSMVKKVNQINIDGSFVKEWFSMADASIATNATPRGISRCAKGKQKTSGGFKWEYA